MNEIMQQGLQRYLDRLPQSARDQYERIASFYSDRFESVALYRDGSPVFDVDGLIIRVGLFADHANIFVRGSTIVSSYFPLSQLTPKGMVQWFYRDPFPRETLTQWTIAEIELLEKCIEP